MTAIGALVQIETRPSAFVQKQIAATNIGLELPVRRNSHTIETKEGNMKARILSVFILVGVLALLITLAVIAKEPEPNTLPLDGEGPSPASSGVSGRDTEASTAVQNTTAFTPTWWSGGPIGAGVNAIAFDPVISHTVYVATGGGGLYRSTDGGDTWDDGANDPDQGLNLGQGHGRVRDVATAEGVVYAATTGYEWFHWSTDGGDTWSHTSGGPWWVEDLAVHPTVTTTLYVAGDDVYASLNGGQSWFPSSTGIAPNDWIRDLAINPDTPTIIYAASDGNKVYRTADGGAHWSNSGTGLPNQIVWSIAVNPLTPTIVYAGLEAEGVWRSEDSGANWSQWSGSDIHCPFIREVVVDPADPNTVYIGTDGAGVYKRSEGDVFWTHLGPFYSTGQRRVYAIGMTANAPGTVFAGVWGDGIYKSTNGGQNWQARNVNLSAIGINRIAADPSHPGTTYATARGGLFRTIDGGETWERIRDTGTWLYSDAYALAIEDSKGTIYVGMYASIITTTNGTNWYDASNGLTAASVWDMAINPITPTTVYAAQRWGNTSDIGVYRSENSGASWVRTSSGITDTNVTAIAVDPTSPQTIYAGTEKGNVFRSSDGGDSWTWGGRGLVVQSGWPKIWDIVPDPQAPGVVYLAQSNDGVGGQGGIYKSTDYGVTWERVLEGHDPQALIIDPLNHKVLITASWNDYLYRSEDGGDTWSAYDTDAFTGYRYVQALAVGTTEGSGWQLYAGTGTNSIWQRDIYTAVFLPLMLKSY